MQKSSLSFTNHHARNRIYDQANAVAIEIKHAAKVYHWIADTKSRSAGLEQLENT